jgi:serine/threonine protein kinase
VEFVSQSNVLIDDHGEALLSDFGFTRIRHELTRTGTRSAAGGGTLRYLAPEVFSGEVPRANVATDIYSLALTIWELASSEPPFSHLNGFLVLARVSKGERPPMPTMIGTFDNQSEAGKAIWGLLVQMWSQDPENRPPMKLVKEKIDLIE